MTVKDMLRIERSKRPGTVALFVSGKFYTACEVSAYMLWRLYGFHVTKRHIKAAECDVVSVGFPQKVLSKYVPGAVAHADGWVEGPLDVSAEDFEEWKASLPYAPDRADKTAGHQLAGIEGFYGQASSGIPLPARFDGLSVYKEVYDLLLILVEWGKNLDRVYQHHLLNRMVDRLFELEVHICTAREQRTTAEAAAEVGQARRNLVEVCVALRMLGDKNRLPANQHADAMVRVASIDRQLESWRATLP